MSRIFGGIRQNGYVVRDIRAAMKHWTDKLAVGPFFFVEEAPIDDFHYMGEPSSCRPSASTSAMGWIVSSADIAPSPL